MFPNAQRVPRSGADDLRHAESLAGAAVIEDVKEIEATLAELEYDRALLQLGAFAARQDAADFLESTLIDGIESLLAAGGQSDHLVQLRRRADSLRCAMVASDERLFRNLRERIRGGDRGPGGWDELLGQYVDASPGNHTSGLEYDHLDALVNGVLRLDAPLGKLREQSPDMVAYQPTPARLVFDMVARAGIGPRDVFFDIGSGLGQPAILVALLSGAKVIGIEYQPAYSDYATACAGRLGLTDIEFQSMDAREADYTTGTVFYLYTPFVGDMLRDVLGMLRSVAGWKAIRLCTYGPCTHDVASQDWLVPISGQPDSKRTILVFGSGVEE